jgi:hypothetical protein
MSIEERDGHSGVVEPGEFAFRDEQSFRAWNSLHAYLLYLPLYLGTRRDGGACEASFLACYSSEDISYFRDEPAEGEGFVGFEAEQPLTLLVPAGSIEEDYSGFAPEDRRVAGESMGSHHRRANYVSQLPPPRDARSAGPDLNGCRLGIGCESGEGIGFASWWVL